VYEHFTAKVFLNNINPILGEKGFEHVNSSFMHMVHLLIENEKFLVRSNLLKYTSSSSNKDSGRKPYNKNDDNLIDAVEPTNQDKLKDRKSSKYIYPLLINPNMFRKRSNQMHLRKGICT